MTRPSLLRILWTYIKEYVLAVISVALIYGGIHQIISAIQALIYPIASTVPLFVDAIVHSEFHYLPSLLSYYSDVRMWAFLTTTVAIAVIAIVVGILVGLWAHSRSQRVPVPNS